MNEVEKNTKDFYNELNNDCNIDKLKQIAKNKIFLYEPLFTYDKIKYEKFVITLSVESHQNFMIYTTEQYNEFIYLINKNSYHYPYFKNFFKKELNYMNALFILNNNLISFLVNDKNNEEALNLLLLFFDRNSSIYLYYLYKYYIIRHV